MKTDELRQRFLDFFNRQGHVIVRSDSLMPANDPTLLFTGAGMNQFKEYFMGLKRDMRRATSSQKCLRTGDLDNVGKTSYHHSFFEMLGNFSFADYFKREAIHWAWQFLTEELGLPKERLRVSVHRTDQEAYDLWHREEKLPAEMISRFSDKDNFWPSNAPEEGPNGPCGPCSEIFYDQGPAYGNGDPNEDVSSSSGRFAEIWNLVFTQFDRIGVRQLHPLPFKNIDTGMGLERLACVMQGKHTNFEIDLFEEMLAYLMELVGKKSYQEYEKRDSLFAITDHVRAISFSIADGAYPSNEGRGYVIRKLIRRAVWHGKRLGLEKPFLSQMVPLLCGAMGGAYPELGQSREEIETILTLEEKRFLETLEEGLVRVETFLNALQKDGRKIVPGEEVFRLYDTYGFPDELTAMIAAEKGLGLDITGFEKLMQQQRQQARGASKISDAIFAVDALDGEILKFEKTQFHGYESCDLAGCKVLGLIVNGIFVEEIRQPGAVTVILDQTPFYAESGGQVGDRGLLSSEDALLEVKDTQKKDAVILHLAELKKGILRVGNSVMARVDSARKRTMANHSATHLLHAALREKFGNQIRQMGSEVTPEKFRFDFSFSRALTADEITQLEERVNQAIMAAYEANIVEKNIDQAQKEGALMFFGDKYGDRVRVVSFGNFSKELCGGTHVYNTADIKDFKIVRETSISSGVRRIEALTGTAVTEYLKLKQAEQEHAEEKRNAKKQEQQEKLRRVDAFLTSEAFNQFLAAGSVLPSRKEVTFYGTFLEGFDREGLLKVQDQMKQRLSQEMPWGVCLIGKDAGSQKLVALVAISAACVGLGLHAGQMAKEVATKLGGSGGGKDTLAFAGGDNASAITEVLSDFGLIPKP